MTRPLPRLSACSRLRVIAVALLAATWSESASAGNDDEVLIGTDAVMMGGAVTAIADDGSALWYNPAGLSSQSTQQVDVNGTAYTLRIWKIPEYLKGPDGSTANANTSEAVVVPSAITYVRSLNDKWTVGGGYFLSRWSDLRGHSELRFPDGGAEAVWQVGYVQTYSLHNVALGASYKQSKRLSWGFALLGMYNGIYYANEISGGIENGIDSSFLSITEHGGQSHYGLQAQLGFVWSPLHNLRVGFSARTPAVSLLHSYQEQSYTTFGFDLAQVPEVIPPDDVPSRPLIYGTTNDEKNEWAADWMLPARFRLGIAHQLERTLWSFDVDVQSAIKSQTVELEGTSFQATNRRALINARLGLQQTLSDTLSLGAGLFTDRRSEKEEVIGIGRFDFYGVSLGGEFSNVHQLASSERAPAIRFSTVLGVRYAYGIGEIPSPVIPNFDQVVRRVLAGNTQFGRQSTRAHAHELSLNLGGGLYF